MNFLTKYGLALFYTLTSVIVTLLLVTLMYHFNIIGDKLFSFLKLLIVIISIFVNSFILGRKIDKKGYLEGLRFGLLIILLIFLPTIISGNFKIKLLIYYTIIVITSIFGGMIGISKKGN